MHNSPERGSRRFRLVRKRWLLAGSLVAALAITVPVAWATFGDVPPGNPFYADINAIQGAGITSGCGSGNFCPDTTIPRQAEAAFVHRGLGRVAQSTALTHSTVTDADGERDLGSVTINVGGVAGNQFVTVRGTVSIYGTGGDCPCNMGIRLQELGSIAVVSEYDQIPIATYNQKIIHIEYVFSATPGNHTYVMSMSLGSAASFSLIGLDLNATTSAFGSGGANILGTESGIPTKTAGGNQP